MSKHTHGPWRQSPKSKLTPNRGIYDNTGSLIATVHLVGCSTVISDRRIADATLIAAAPQMLEALRMFWRAERLNDEQYAEALRAADAAIIAATREAK